MSRRLLVRAGMFLVAGTLLLSGCGEDRAAQDASPPRASGKSGKSMVEVGSVEEATSVVATETSIADEEPAGTDGSARDASGGVDDTRTRQDGELSGAPGDAGVPAAVTPSAPVEDELLDEMDTPYLDNVQRPQTSPDGLSVTRAYICRGIEESEPTDAGRSFLPKEDWLNRLCCFSEITGAARPDSIWHVWFWGDREMGRVGLEVKGDSWRTWSRKQVHDDWTGEWHVDIVDANGFLLYRLEFSIE
jgi:hypothetical protein